MVAGAMRRRCNASYDMSIWWPDGPCEVVQGSGCTYFNWQQLAGSDLCRASAIAVLLLPAAKRRQLEPRRRSDRVTYAPGRNN